MTDCDESRFVTAIMKSRTKVGSTIGAKASTNGTTKRGRQIEEATRLDPFIAYKFYAVRFDSIPGSEISAKKPLVHLPPSQLFLSICFRQFIGQPIRANCNAFEVLLPFTVFFTRHFFHFEASEALRI